MNSARIASFRMAKILPDVRPSYFKERIHE